MALPTPRDRLPGVPALRSWFDELFDDDGTSRPATRRPHVFSRDFVPPLNVAETEKSFEVTLEAPGLEEQDLDIQVMGNQITISGGKKPKADGGARIRFRLWERYRTRGSGQDGGSKEQ